MSKRTRTRTRPFVNRMRLERVIAELRAEANELAYRGDEPTTPEQEAWLDEGYRRGLLCAAADLEENCL